MATNLDLTIVEKYQQNKDQTIAVRPYFNPAFENMGLEKYNMTVHDGVYHMEELTCLEINGIKRYITGLNEFAPEVKALPTKERAAKIKEIRTMVAELEQQLAANVIDVEDPEFWNKVTVLKPDNYEFWSKMNIKVGNDPLYLDPKSDPYDLIKLCAIRAGGFSLVAKSLEDAKKVSGCRFYLDELKKSTESRTKLSKLRNKALSSLQNLFDEDTTKLFYVTKLTDSDSSQYIKSTPIDILYENMDLYINGMGYDENQSRCAKTFIENASDTMENLKLRTLVKDATFYQVIITDSKGYIIDAHTKARLGKNTHEVLEFLKNPVNDDILESLMERIEDFWNS